MVMGAAGSKLEKALGDQFPEGERYFGLENFGNTCYCNTCYCNSVLQIRLAEAQLKGEQQHLKPEQLEKMSKLDGWRDELKLLEDKKANLDS